ncbi:MAG: twin-arginine translocase subunit TatC, partial [Coriobacteriaceae bacterium]|nr:twin-arginine translocase subunit TatC [Coriobacteriaceae bacterium]
AVFCLGLYPFADPIFRFLTAPVQSLVGDKTVVLTVFGSMMAKFTLSLWAGIVFASPVITWQVMAFFLPALRPNERRWVVPTFFAMVVLFVTGMAFCYTLILPTAFKWLIDQAGTTFTYLPTGMDLIQSILYFLLGFGIAFQTPVVVFYLVYFGIVPYKTLRENWRIAYVVITVVAAMATPDWSPVSMGALAGSMVVLYEMSLLLVRFMLGKRIAHQRAALDAE